MIDLREQQFGELTVIEDTGKRTKANLVIWKCLCSCGNVCEADSHNLIRGHKKSCGHLHKTVKKGEKYGKLTVLSLLNKRSSDGYILCRCKCDCGTICEINSHSMKQGLVTSCGCVHKASAIRNGRKVTVDLTNKRFGKLVALHPTEERNGTNIKWLCRCDCGNFVKVNTGSLQIGACRSCGCVNSWGEEKITSLLRESNILFKLHYRVTINHSYRFFDIAILDKQHKPIYFIEYDGKQHFETGGWNTDIKLKQTKESDALKNQWCLKNSIPLIRIPYTHFDVICVEDLLLESSKFIVRSK